MSTKTVLRATIAIDGPWLVGDPVGAGDRHTTPLREPDGTPQVPTTSLAGSLRHHLGQHLTEAGLVDLMGGAAPPSDDRNDDGKDDNRPRVPSRLRVLGTRMSCVKDRTVPRTSTAVSQVTGSGLHNTLRTDEFVDATAVVTVYLSADGTLSAAEIDAVASWTLRVGRRRTNGWGVARLTALRTGTVDLRRRDHLVRWLSGGGPGLIDSLLTEDVKVSGSTPPAEVCAATFTVDAGVHIGAGTVDGTADGDADDVNTPERHAAAVVTRNRIPIVPSTTWRGVVRAQCGFILRSVGCADADTDRAIAWIFGDQHRRGMLTFHDADITPEPGAGADVPVCEHVAIDRITGGARDGLLFAEQVARGTTTLRITAERPDQLPDWLADLLGHVVQDIADGYRPVGGRATRGLGALRLADPGAAAALPAGGIDPAAVAASLPAAPVPAPKPVLTTAAPAKVVTA